MSDNQQFCLRWNNHQSTLVQVIDSLLSSGVLVDCTLAAEGQYLHAHKVVLCACSPYLETLLSQHYEKHPIVILKDVKFQELKSMMDYMYKGEVNISQDQLGQFLKAAESLQIKGLTDGGGGENDSRDVGSTSQKRHDPPPRKPVPHNQSRSPVVLPSHGPGLTIEPSKRSLPSHLSESQPDSPIRSREGSSSPTPRKRRRPRRPSQGDDDGHQDNCDLPMQQQSILNTVPIIPQLPAGSSSTITKAPPPDEEPDQPAESDVRLAEAGLLKEKIEPQSELLIEPKTEYMEETNNDDSVEDLTLDDDDEYDGMDAAGPSHGGDNSNQSYGQWQMGERTHDEVFMAAQEAVGGPRDSQDKKTQIKINKDQSTKLHQLVREKRKYTIEEVRKHAFALGLPTVNCVHWLKQRGVVVEERKNVSRLSVATQNLLKRRRSKFFDSLPYEKKIVVLKKTQYTLKHSSRLIQELATKLELPVVRLSNWMHHRKRRYLTRDQVLSNEIIEVLADEFKKCDYWDEEHILLLSNQLNVSLPLIKKWYSDERMKHQSSKKTDTLVTESASKLNVSVEKRGKEMKTTWQKDVLFEAFKQSPGAVTSETLSRLRETTKLSAKQISNWLSCIRVKWSQANVASLKNNLTRKVTKEQLQVLEKQYRRCRFLEDDVTAELVKNVGIPIFTMKAWFSNRRVYEILTNDKDLVAVGYTKDTVVERKANKPSKNLDVPREELPSRMVVKNENKIFFDSLSKNQKQRLMKSVKCYNLSYKRLSHSLNLPVDQVRNWLMWKRNLSDNLKEPNRAHYPAPITRALIARYNKSQSISKEEAIAFASKLKLQPTQVEKWFVNRRRRDKIRSLNGEVIEYAVSDQPQSVSFAEEIKTEEGEGTTGSCNETLVEIANKSEKYHQKDITQKNVLFDEFKKSRELNMVRINALSNRLSLTPLQVRKWFYNFNKSYISQTEEKILKIVENEAIDAEKLAKLVAEFSKSRYASVQKIEQLAEQTSLSYALVKRWFSSARWYEVHFGHVPGVKGAPLSNPSSSLSVGIARKKLRGAGKITMKKLQILKKEFQKDEFITNERAKALCFKLKISVERIKLWFENRRNLKAEKERKASENTSDLPTFNIFVPKVSTPTTSARLKTNLSNVSTNVIKEESFDEKDEASSIASYCQPTPHKDKKNYSCKMPIQQNKLFEEFKKSPSLPNRRLAKLSEELGLLDKQISAWFHWMRSKLSTLSKQDLDEEYRNRNLNLEQIAMLELEYEKSRYITRERREELSNSLQLTKTAIKTWFANRRYYEILSSREESQVSSSEPEKTDVPELDDDSEVGLETVIDYDWEDENNATEFVEAESNGDLEYEYKIENAAVSDGQDDDPCEFLAEDEYFPETQSEFYEEQNDSLDASPHTDPPFQTRERFITLLEQNLEPIDQDVEVLFWYMSKTPNQSDEATYTEIDELRDHSLNLEFQKNPWPTLEKISLLSKKLNVSEPKIHWWFMKKRCFLTKTILTVPPSSQKITKSSNKIVIDLTEDEARSAENLIGGELKSPEPEFIALNESEIKSEEFVDENLENDVNASPLSASHQQDAESDNDETSRLCENNLNEPLEVVQSSAASTVQNLTSTKKVKSSKKKTKISLTSHQRAILLREFKRSKFISTSKARMLAQDLSLSVNKVDNWFEYMRNKAEKKINPVEKAPVSLDNLTPSIIESLEAEFERSQNLSEKRAKMIAVKLKTRRRIVRQWFIERINRRDSQ